MMDLRTRDQSAVFSTYVAMSAAMGRRMSHMGRVHPAKKDCIRAAQLQRLLRRDEFGGRSVMCRPVAVARSDNLEGSSPPPSRHWFVALRRVAAGCSYVGVAPPSASVSRLAEALTSSMNVGCRRCSGAVSVNAPANSPPERQTGAEMPARPGMRSPVIVT